MSLIRMKSNYQNKIESKSIEPDIGNFTQPIKEIETKTKNPNHNLMIGEGVTINGNVKSDNEVIIQGTVEGDVECNSITIDNSGYLKGKIKTENMLVKGRAEGEISVNSLLEIKSKGDVSGKVFYGGIQIEEEGKLAGEINYNDSKNKQEEFKDWKTLWH